MAQLKGPAPSVADGSGAIPSRSDDFLGDVDDRLEKSKPQSNLASDTADLLLDGRVRLALAVELPEVRDAR